MATSSTSFQGSVATPWHGNPNGLWLSRSMGDPAFLEDAESSKALVVDDNPDVLMTAARMFEHLGYEVVTASNGAEAMEALRQAPDISVLFTDVVMPGMNGIQLGNDARKLIPNLKVILVSGYPKPAMVAGHGNLHDFDFLRKPYRLAEVIKLLGKQS